MNIQNKSSKVLTVLVFLLVIFAAHVFYLNLNKKESLKVNVINQAPSKLDRGYYQKLALPIDRAKERITKKPFGIKVSPQDSPVSPKRFHGYHTGIDFETFANEQNSDIPIYSICTGPLLLKKQANGYGGMAVQKCKIDNNDITVVYGHLQLKSIAINVDQELRPGQQIGILGMSYNQETDGERKHLHLGIHKGTAIDTRGYVQNRSELNQWIDFKKYLD